MPSANQPTLTAISAGTARLRVAFDKLPRDAWHWKPAANKWSAAEVVIHVVETDIVYLTRMAFAAAEPGKTVMGFDQDKWATELKANDRDVEQAFATMAVLRAFIVNMLQALPPDAWERKANHSERGPVSLRQFADGIAKHCDDHVAQLERNLAAWNARK